jgi:hypothetical protein
LSYYFYFQRVSKESAWELSLSEQRAKVIAEVKPVFSTVLDFSGVPDDNDWAKVKYTGPLYFDFDADGDLDLVCAQLRNFLGKLTTEVNFDITQARMFASGSKGFHVEIPQACFIAKPAAGYVWLPYIYRELAQNLMVDTLDLAVYTGKRGRQWRTTNVQRENGCYKVPITAGEALTINPETYLELIQAPRHVEDPLPPTTNAAFAMLFERAKDKVVLAMRGRKKRQEKANAILDPYRKAKRHPPTVERMMAGEGLAEGVGFQAVAMQLAIYAVSVGLSLDDFLTRCAGLIDKHHGDSWRYGSPERRRTELARMWEYMGENSFYDFDAGPLVRLLAPGVKASDLGVITPDAEPAKAEAPPWDGEGDAPPPEGMLVDSHQTFRRGVFLNSDGLFIRTGDEVKSLCRATFGSVTSFFRLPDLGDPMGQATGLEILTKAGHRSLPILFDTDNFNSAAALKRVLSAHFIPYQGNDNDTTALFDIMINKSGDDNRVYTYPREGLSVVQNPQTGDPTMVFLTQDTYRGAVAEGHPDYFRLRYRPEQAESAYRIDVHLAGEMSPDHAGVLRDLFRFNRSDIVADTLGWMVACHFRSLYLHCFQQFPLLHVFGEAGAGKTQTLLMLSHLHWGANTVPPVRSASGGTEYVLDNYANSSASAPLILDEYKPREMRAKVGRVEKLKDLFKNSYTGSNLAGRGHLNKGAVNSLSIVQSRASAPIAFIGEAMEGETALVERSVIVALSQSFITDDRRRAFENLRLNPAPLSAIGRRIVEMAPFVNFDRFKAEVQALFNHYLAHVPRNSEGRPIIADRMLFNRTVVVHGLTLLKGVLRQVHGSLFEETINTMIAERMKVVDHSSSEIRSGAISEISKVISRIAILSSTSDRPYSLVRNQDYCVGPGWVEVRIERAYDNYRLYCAATHETPLFDNYEAFLIALQLYGPVIDHICENSVFRRDETNERIVKFDTTRLTQSGVRSFKS